ncbi:hypothetical protein R3P38DRAFT_3409360 [Favolaschia claudopus]|uniref:GAR domain-containing protein n=1 Tax=Favolaschia claudopus TaxID=2862362 RepID=A0AAV9ZQY5_9AGAR
MSATTQTSPHSPARSLEEHTPLPEIPGHLGKDNNNPNRLAPTTMPTPLADGLKASLSGRPSNTRSITRTSTAPAVIPYGASASRPTRIVDTFEHFHLESPPADKRETMQPMAARTEKNRANDNTPKCLMQILTEIGNFDDLGSDAVGTIDTRVESVSRRLDNLETQQRVLAHNPRSDDPRDTVEHPTPPSPNPSSVGAPELEDELVGRLEEVELKLSNVSDVTDAHERSLSDLTDKLDVPFALSHLRDATQEQFAKARKERQELADRVESDYKNQRRDKRDYDEKMAGIRADVDQIKAALARLELAVIPPPLPPRVPSPTRRVSPLPRRALSPSRPRSRSPQPGFKRSRPATADSGDIDFGPVSRDLTDHLSARSVFELHLATALPQHPSLGAFEIERKNDVLRISGLPSGVATALVRAWGDHSVEGYKFIKMKFVGGDAGNNSASGGQRVSNTAAGRGNTTSHRKFTSNNTKPFRR